MSTVLTATGRHIKLDGMTELDVCVADIIQGLNNVKRFNGRGVTVLQHTMVMYQYVNQHYHGDNRSLILAGILLHDMAEAYTGDIIQPVKAAVPEIAELEDVVNSAIYKYFTKEWPMDRMSEAIYDHVTEVVKHIDRLAMAAEYQNIFSQSYTQSDPLWGISTLDEGEMFNMERVFIEVTRRSYPNIELFEALCYCMRGGWNFNFTGVINK